MGKQISRRDGLLEEHQVAVNWSGATVLPSWGAEAVGSLGFQLGGQQSAVLCPGTSIPVRSPGKGGGVGGDGKRQKLETVSSLMGLLLLEKAFRKPRSSCHHALLGEGACNPGCILDPPRDHLKTLPPAVPQDSLIRTPLVVDSFSICFSPRPFQGAASQAGEQLLQRGLVPLHLWSCEKAEAGLLLPPLNVEPPGGSCTQVLRGSSTRLYRGSKVFLVESEPHGSFPAEGSGMGFMVKLLNRRGRAG